MDTQCCVVVSKGDEFGYVRNEGARGVEFARGRNDREDGQLRRHDRRKERLAARDQGWHSVCKQNAAAGRAFGYSAFVRGS
jgi:hypothetical protein